MPLELLIDLPEGDDNGPEEPPKPEPKAKPTPQKEDIKDLDLKPDQDEIIKPETKTEPKKKTPPKKEETQKKPATKNKIEVSTKKVTRSKSPGGGKSKLTAAEVQRLLDRGAKIGKPTLSDKDLRTLLNSDTRFGDGNAMTQEAVYLDIIKQTMYRAWDQPTSLGIAGLVARVEFSFNSDGSISSCKMAAASGNSTMDESVMRAARAVRRINGVPPTYLLSHRRITVAFELTGGD